MYSVFRVAVVVLAAFVFVSCDIVGSRDKIEEKSIDREGYPIKTTVRFYDSKRDLHRKYEEIHETPAESDLLGFARWPERRDEGGNAVEQPDLFRCDIHTLRPETINDDATLTLGHELLHCIWGTYHD